MSWLLLQLFSPDTAVTDTAEVRLSGSAAVPVVEVVLATVSVSRGGLAAGLALAAVFVVDVGLMLSVAQ